MFCLNNDLTIEYLLLLKTTKTSSFYLGVVLNFDQL